MKWNLRNAFILIALATSATPIFAKHALILAGLDAAKNYQGKSNRHIYIRAGSFTHETNAKEVRAALRSRLNYPVKVAYKHGYYAVTIGPVASAAATRKIGEKIPADLKMTPAKPATPAVVAPSPAAPVKPITPAVVPKQPVAAEIAMPIIHTSQPIVTLPADWSRAVYISAGAGDMFNRVSGNNVLGTGDGWPDDNYVTNGITDQPYFALAAGYIWARPSDLVPFYSAGLKMTYVSTSTVSGYIDQYSLPEFRNYNFKYDIQLFNVMATVKADLYRWKNFMPYITGGLGVTNYYTSQYTETPTGGVTPRVSPGFGAGSGNNFSYTAGVGIDYAMMQNLWVNIEYNYFSFGNVGTDNGQNYATLTGTNYDNESLKHNLSATSIFLGLTYYVS